mmetsp:Transcript_20549/g.69855  ORF Transcript_20549/g.69855 Transcript_20549/m.69855 type:complete len:303 (+) Transcript_20549:238-1146(+)
MLERQRRASPAPLPSPTSCASKSESRYDSDSGMLAPPAASRGITATTCGKDFDTDMSTSADAWDARAATRACRSPRRETMAPGTTATSSPTMARSRPDVAGPAPKALSRKFMKFTWRPAWLKYTKAYTAARHARECVLMREPAALSGLAFSHSTRPFRAASDSGRKRKMAPALIKHTSAATARPARGPYSLATRPPRGMPTTMPMPTEPPCIFPSAPPRCSAGVTSVTYAEASMNMDEVQPSSTAAALSAQGTTKREAMSSAAPRPAEERAIHGRRPCVSESTPTTVTVRKVKRESVDESTP